MLEPKSSEENSQVTNLSGKSAVVRTQKREIAIRCKYLDKVTSKADICAALAGQTQKNGDGDHPATSDQRARLCQEQPYWMNSLSLLKGNVFEETLQVSLVRKSGVDERG